LPQDVTEQVLEEHTTSRNHNITWALLGISRLRQMMNPTHPHHSMHDPRTHTNTELLLRESIS